MVLHKNQQIEPGMVAHAFNPNTREAEAGGFLSSRPAWSTE
jgi:major histocompatibility complex class I